MQEMLDRLRLRLRVLGCANGLLWVHARASSGVGISRRLEVFWQPGSMGQFCYLLPRDGVHTRCTGIFPRFCSVGPGDAAETVSETQVRGPPHFPVAEDPLGIQTRRGQWPTSAPI